MFVFGRLHKSGTATLIEIETVEIADQLYRVFFFFCVRGEGTHLLYRLV